MNKKQTKKQKQMSFFEQDIPIKGYTFRFIKDWRLTAEIEQAALDVMILQEDKSALESLMRERMLKKDADTADDEAIEWNERIQIASKRGIEFDQEASKLRELAMQRALETYGDKKPTEIQMKQIKEHCLQHLSKKESARLLALADLRADAVFVKKHYASLISYKVQLNDDVRAYEKKLRLAVIEPDFYMTVLPQTFVMPKKFDLFAKNCDTQIISTLSGFFLIGVMLHGNESIADLQDVEGIRQKLLGNLKKTS